MLEMVLALYPDKIHIKTAKARISFHLMPPY